MIATSTQTLIFFRSIFLGALLGIFYDLFRLLRLVFPAPGWVVAAEDLLFFLLSAIWSFGFIMSVNYGQVRAFILMGEGLGFLLYYLTVGTLVVKSAKSIVSAVKKLLFTLWKYSFGPVFSLVYTRIKKIGKRAAKAHKMPKKVVEIHRKHLQKHGCRCIIK